MKRVLKYFLTVSILLLMGYSQLFANLFRSRPTELSQNTEKSFHQDAAHQSAKLEVYFEQEEEEDEEDKLFLKKFNGLVQSSFDYHSFYNRHNPRAGYDVITSHPSYLEFRVLRI